MNIVLSLDYEIWFGRNGALPHRTLVEPTDALRALARRHGVRLVFFVDALWLLRLRDDARRHPVLMAEHYRVARQLDALAAEGHELQLHLHPHWLDSHWDGDDWALDLRRYRLHDFADDEIAGMVTEGANVLRAHAGSVPVSAFRAGGWCLQPFARLRDPLRAAGIRIDSTVYAGGVEEGEGRRYDFRAAPALGRWRFDSDPLQPRADGAFLELPIASQQLPPWFFWQLAFTKVLGLGAHRVQGPGAALPLSRADLLRRLSRPSTSVVSSDGLKASRLAAAFDAQRRRGLHDFVVIGHPKALTLHALRALDHFITAHRGAAFCGMNDYLGELAESAGTPVAA